MELSEDIAIVIRLTQSLGAELVCQVSILKLHERLKFANQSSLSFHYPTVYCENCASAANGVVNR